MHTQTTHEPHQAETGTFQRNLQQSAMKKIMVAVLLSCVLFLVGQFVMTLARNEQQAVSHIYSAIILSGYSDFEYARTAIQYGVTGYLLKPLKTAELTEAVNEAKEQCRIRHNWQEHLQESEELKQTKLLPENYGEDKIVLAMLQYIRDHYKEKLTMQDVMAELNYSETFLNKRFKKQMETTFNEYLNRFRIQKAMELLKTGGTICFGRILGVRNPRLQIFQRRFSKIRRLQPKGVCCQDFHSPFF